MTPAGALILLCLGLAAFDRARTAIRFRRRFDDAVYRSEHFSASGLTDTQCRRILRDVFTDESTTVARFSGYYRPARAIPGDRPRRSYQIEPGLSWCELDEITGRVVEVGR